MSAFVVSSDCMVRAVQAICARNTYGQVIRTFDGIATEGDGAATEIGRRLFTLNIEAVQQRYPETLDAPDNLPGPCDDNGNSTALRDAIDFCCGVPRRQTSEQLAARLKALQCVAYQCAEGDIPDTPLYRELERAIGLVACEIVSRLPAYDQAEWG